MQSTFLRSEKPRASCFPALSLLVMLCGGATLLTPTEAVAGQTYYVNNSSSAAMDQPAPTYGTQAKPWKTVTYAATQINGGDTVKVSPGTYNNERVIIGSTKSGMSGSPTTFTALNATQPLIRGNTDQSIFEVNNASFVVINGFDVQNTFTSPANNSTGDGNGIVVKTYSTNVTVSYNTVHDCGGAGIAFTNKCDYYKIDHNTVYNCAARSIFHTSGISVLLADFVVSGGSGVDGKGYNGVITNNQSHNNSESTRTDGSFAETNTDGNGIIVDTSNQFNDTNKTFPANYVGPKVLVERNNVYSNGGRGICVTKNSNVTIQYNTIAYDLQDSTFANTTDAELQATYGLNCVFQHNNVRTYNFSNAATVTPASLRGTPRIFNQYMSTNITATDNGPDVTF